MGENIIGRETVGKVRQSGERQWDSGTLGNKDTGQIDTVEGRHSTGGHWGDIDNGVRQR